MHYYLKADLRGCHAGEKIKIIDKVGIYVRALMGNEVVPIPIRIFPMLFSKEPAITQEAYEYIYPQKSTSIARKKNTQGGQYQ